MPSATPFFRSFATRTFATPKNLSLILEALVDKEVAKLVEEVNEELVMDVVVEGVVDKLVEVNKELVMDVVVEEVNRELLKEFNEGLVKVYLCKVKKIMWSLMWCWMR